jgi:hypothetical protein
MLGMALEMKRLKENFVELSDDLNMLIVVGSLIVFERYGFRYPRRV